MTYQTILVHIDESERSNLRARLATQIAARSQAHITGAAVTGISRFIFEGGNISASDPNFTIHLASLREHAEKARAQFSQTMTGVQKLPFDSTTVNDDAAGGLGMRARYCDLIVIGQTDPNHPSPSISPDFPEYMVLNSGRPVLIIPHSKEFTEIGRRSIIAWDGSRAATRAVNDAIPLLTASAIVYVLILNPDQATEEHGEEPGADIALFLARHGIKIEIATRFTKTDIAESILQVAKENSCDLLVMGGYGHTRFREMIMGGTTKTILEKMNLPVLMSH